MTSILYYFRTLLAAFILFLASVYGVITSTLLTVINKQEYSQYVCARFYYGMMKYLMRIDVKVINEHYLYDLPFVAVSNHQSALDILVIGKALPPGCTVTAKKSLKYIPILGWYMSISGTYFLERTNREKSVETLKRGLQNLKKNKRALWIFAEGTRSHSSELGMLPFKKGAFHLAQQGGIPILPIVVSNTSTLWNNKWGIFNRGCLTVKVLKPIQTTHLKPEDVGKFSEMVREKMVKELKENVGYSEFINDTNIPPNV